MPVVIAPAIVVLPAWNPALKPHMLRVCYLINQYPKISHTFIRREIQAVEQRGVQVFRVSVRGWDAEIVDDDDRLEREKTTYILSGGLPGLAKAFARMALTRPLRVMRALGTALPADISTPFPIVLPGVVLVLPPWLCASS